MSSTTSEDTIAAIATPHGRGGVAIVRISGCNALQVAKKITGITPKPRHAYFRPFIQNGETVDEGVVIFFPAPHSYTGEDVLELQGHAGNIQPQRVLSAVLSCPGIRQANPGEFTRRAFMNGKMDLTAAEAVEDLISAGSESAAKAAMASLDGAFARDMHKLSDQITSFRVKLEGCLDFPEEHEDFFDSGKAVTELKQIQALACEAKLKASQGLKLTEGAKIVLSGAPNAGKSSLLNALSGTERAIVTNIPGTTRDLLTADIEINGVPVTITDTAGIRDTPSDEIEAIGIRKAVSALKQADLVILMIDGSVAPEPDLLQKISDLKELNSQILIAISKSDLPQNPQTTSQLNSKELSYIPKLQISVKTSEGLLSLRKKLSESLGIIPIEGVYSARSRHLSALNDSIEALTRASQILEIGDLVLCAQEMKLAQDSLGMITGKVSSDDLLGKIFSTFCIGK